MKTQVKGPLKYLIASLVFGIVGLIFSINEILKIVGGKQSFTIIFVLGMLPFSVLLFKLFREYKKSKTEPLNGKILPLFVGYIFTWIGAGFTYVSILGILKNDESFYVLFLISLLFFGLLGLPLLIPSTRMLFNPNENNEKKIIKAVKFVTICATIMGLSPIIIIIIGVFYAGYYVGGSISVVVLGFIIWLFFKLKNRK